jgi:hypothetical protein
LTNINKFLVKTKNIFKKIKKYIFVKLILS